MIYLSINILVVRYKLCTDIRTELLHDIYHFWWGKITVCCRIIIRLLSVVVGKNLDTYSKNIDAKLTFLGFF